MHTPRTLHSKSLSMPFYCTFIGFWSIRELFSKGTRVLFLFKIALEQTQSPHHSRFCAKLFTVSFVFSSTRNTVRVKLLNSTDLRLRVSFTLYIVSGGALSLSVLHIGCGSLSSLFGSLSIGVRQLSGAL